MPHDSKTVLASLGPCASGYKFALQHETFEEAMENNTDPTWHLWFFLSIAQPARSKKALLATALSGLFQELSAEFSPETIEALRPALEALSKMSSSVAPTLFPTLSRDVVAPSSQTGMVVQAVNLGRSVEQALLFCQDNVTPELVNDLAPKMCFGVQGCLKGSSSDALLLLRKYLTNPVWYFIEAST